MKTQRGTLPKKFITTLKKAEPKEILNKLIPFMVRQAHHERNQLHAVRPELVEGLNQRSLKSNFAIITTCCNKSVLCM